MPVHATLLHFFEKRRKQTYDLPTLTTITITPYIFIFENHDSLLMTEFNYHQKHKLVCFPFLKDIIELLIWKPYCDFLVKKEKD